MTATATQQHPFLKLLSRSEGALYQLHYYWFMLTLCVTPLSTSVSAFCYGILVVGSVYQMTAQGKWGAVFNEPLVKVFVPGIVLVSLGLLWSLSPLATSLLVWKKYVWLAATPLVMMSLSGNHQQRDIDKLLSAYLCVAGLTLVLSFYYGASRLSVAGAVFKDHIIQSFIFAIALSICLYRAHDNGLAKRVGYLILAALFAISMLFLSDGRSGYILCPLAFLFAFAYLYPLKRFLLLAIAVAVVFYAAFSVSPAMQNRWADIHHSLTIFQTKEDRLTSLGFRLRQWQIAGELQAQYQRRAIGLGTGGIHAPYQRYTAAHFLKYPKGQRLIEKGNLLFDGSYVNFWLQYGPAGVLFIGFWLVALWRLSSPLPDVNCYLARFLLLSLGVLLTINPWMSSSTPSHLLSLFFILCFAKPQITQQ